MPLHVEYLRVSFRSSALSFSISAFLVWVIPSSLLGRRAASRDSWPATFLSLVDAGAFRGVACIHRLDLILMVGLAKSFSLTLVMTISGFGAYGSLVVSLLILRRTTPLVFLGNGEGFGVSDNVEGYGSHMSDIEIPKC